MNENINIKRFLVLEKRYSCSHTIIIDNFPQWLFLSKFLLYLGFYDTIWFFYHFTSYNLHFCILPSYTLTQYL